MELKTFFLLGFIVAFAAAAVWAIFVVLLGKWCEFEFKVLMTTGSIGIYNLIALTCATAYQDEKWKPLS